MKICDVKTVLLTGPCTEDPFLVECRSRRSAAFIEIHTDTEIIGLGETYAGYFCPEAVPPIVDFFRPILVGLQGDELQVDELWRRMYHCGNFWCRVGLGLSVLNGIEAALWDLKGKILRKPVYELLGGRRNERLLAYASGGPSNYPMTKLAAKMDYYQSLGFKGVKFGAGQYWSDKGFVVSLEPAEAADTEAGKLEFLRARTGPDVRILLDGHMGNSPGATWGLETALEVMKAVEPFQLFCFEEPLHYNDPWSYSELCRQSRVPIAGGECLTAISEWRMFVDRDCFDIGQPDASFTGGVGSFLQVASMLQERGRKVASHAWGAGGSLMQNIHAAFACQNAVILEVPPAYGPLHSRVMGESFRMVDGWVLPPEGPGFGIVITDQLKEEFPFVPGSGEFNSVPGKTLEEEQGQ